MNHIHASPTAGFTLVETLIALFVLTVALVGPLGLAFNALQSTKNTEDKIVSFYLAQEAAEFVKNIRDTNVKNSASYLEGLNNPGWGCVAQWCRLDLTKSSLNQVVSKCGSGANQSDCPAFTYDASSNTYAYGGGTATTYKRGVRITDNGHEAVVEVLVTYTVDSVPYTTTIRQTLYNLVQASTNSVPICGNGVCEVSETAAACPADCGAGSAGSDFDGDGYPDAGDNCWCVSNGTQIDSNNDGTGNVCTWGNASFVKCCTASCGQP